MQSYARALSQNAGNPSNGPKHQDSKVEAKKESSTSILPGHNNSEQNSESPRKRSRSPSHRPKTNPSATGPGDRHEHAEEEQLYILTLQTDNAHHKRMTGLRNQYFPRHLNKLEAHLTLFHALPGSRLDSHILPTITRVAAQTSSFRIHAAKPIRLKRGFAIAVPGHQGGREAGEVHRELLGEWKGEGFLSEQDESGGFRAHYTVMNKVEEEEEIEKAFGEVCEAWKGGDWGIAEGLALWRYVKGWWKWERSFDFQRGDTL